MSINFMSNFNVHINNYVITKIRIYFFSKRYNGYTFHLVIHVEYNMGLINGILILSHIF